MAKLREKDTELLKKMRKNGKKRSKEVFTWENACKRYLRAYRNDIDKAVGFIRD